MEVAIPGGSSGKAGFALGTSIMWGHLIVTTEGSGDGEVQLDRTPPAKLELPGGCAFTLG
jgi:hypothetical protein